MKTKTAGYPIMFSASMVIAMLQDRKIKTRRNVKASFSGLGDVEECDKYPGEFFQWKDGERQTSFTCPFGRAGDLLYVREDFKVSSFYDRMSPSQVPALDTVRIHYVADGAPEHHSHAFGKKRENMFMPRWMSRITLELVSVSCERLQEISNQDCIEEGLCPATLDVIRKYNDEAAPPLRGGSPERYLYSKLWEELHGEGSWQINPFVWVLEFKVLHGNIDNILQQKEADNV